MDVVTALARAADRLECDPSEVAVKLREVLRSVHDELAADTENVPVEDHDAAVRYDPHAAVRYDPHAAVRYDPYAAVRYDHDDG